MTSPVHRLSAKNFCVLTSLLLTFFIFQNASAQSCSGNLMYNPGFEENFESQTIGVGWEGTGGTSFSTDARSGQRAIQMGVSDYLRIWQFFPAQPGQEYSASAYLKSNSSGTIGIKFLTADYQPDNLLTSRATNGNYTLVELTRTAPANAAWVEISIYSNANDVVLADDLCFVEGGGTPPTGCVINISNSTPICDNNGTPDNSLDDTFSFEVTATNSNPSSGFQASTSIGGITGNYGTPFTVSGIPVVSLSETVTIVDNDSSLGGCLESVRVLAPPSCSSGGIDSDLTLSVTGTPSNVDAWQFATTTFTLKNEGNFRADGVRVSFNISDNARLKGGDEFTASQGTLQSFWTQVPIWQLARGLEAGESATMQLNIFTLSGDEMPIYGQVSAASGNDPDSSPNNGTPPNPSEDDEAVFTFNGSNTGAQPDLQLANLNIQNSFTAPGEILSYNVDISNLGAGAANGDFKVKSYISTDQNLSADDIQDGELATGNFSANSTVPQVLAASTIPANLAGGTYFLILKIDADEVVAESNENNNLIFATFQVGCVCPTVIDPVCGSDGVTYGNSCEAECAGIFTYTQGACPTGNSCAFITVEDTDPVPDFRQGNDYIFIETGSEFQIQSIRPYARFLNNQTTETYRLALNGDFITSNTITQTFDWEVVLEVDSDKNLEMVFNQSPDVPAGTRISIDYNFTDPTAVIPGTVFKTSTGYAFGMALVTDGSGVGLENKIVQTDDFGQNIRVTDLPNPAFYGGFGRLTEGPDGTIYTWWTTSGNYSMYVAPGDGSPGWYAPIGSDTPSTTWTDVKASPDGNFVYTAKTDNQRVFIGKYNSKTGVASGLDLTNFIATPFGEFRLTWVNGIMPTADGGVLISINFNQPTSGNVRGDILGKLDANGNVVWRLEDLDNNFSVVPVGEASDGGGVFAGTQRIGTTNENGSIFIKTTADGMLTPLCGGGGSPDLVVESFSTSQTSGEPGALVFAEAQIKNQGNADAGNASIRYYLSADPIASPDDFRSQPIAINGSLAAGDTDSAPFTFNVPFNFQNEFYLIIEADSEGNVAESDENNNFSSTLFGVDAAGSCAFVKNYVPQNVPQIIPRTTLPSSTTLTQTPTGYVVDQPSGLNVLSHYELDLDGNVTADNVVTLTPLYEVDLETDTDENLEMVFNVSPDLPAGTRVAIDYNYTDPTDVITGNVFKTSTGYAFGITIIDQSLSPLNIQRIIKTDNFGQNVEVIELPFGDFFSGFGTLTEGSDGGIYTEWGTSGDLSVYGVPPGATTAWKFRVAADTPSSTWLDTDVSDDGQFVYTAKTDNQRAVIAKINAADGTATDIDLTALINASGTNDPRQTNALGIEPTPDGGLLVSLGVYEFLGANPPQAVVLGKLDAAGNLLWSIPISIQSRFNFRLIPIGTTSDGGAFFYGYEDRELPSGDVETVFLKTTSDGRLDPFCGGSLVGADLELSFAPLADPDPAQWSFFPVTLMMKNNGTETVTNAEVQFTKADEVVYQGGNEYTASQGTFFPAGAKNAWFAGDLAPGETATLTVNYFRLSANPFTAYAEVFNMDQDDIDSTPQNGTCCTAAEDDEADLAIGAGSARGVGGRTLLEENISANEGFAIINAAPNPFSDRLSLNIFSAESQSSDLIIYDVLGRPVLRQAVEISEGHNSISIDASDLPTGFLTAKMTPEHKYLRQIRVVKMRD